MTNEDAIWILKHVDAHGIAAEARDMAILALMPNKSGKWYRINNPNFSPFDNSRAYKYQCTVCMKYSDGNYNYCPHCGSCMMGEEKDNDNK